MANIEAREKEKQVAVLRFQQDWEVTLLQFKTEQGRLERLIEQAKWDREQSRRTDKDARQLDEHKITLLNLEYAIRRHFEHGYSSEIFVDVTKKNVHRNVKTRSDRIGGMIYNNYGSPPRIDTATPRGFYRLGFVNALNTARTNWLFFVDDVNRFYDRNKGDIRALCEMMGDGFAGALMGGGLGRVGRPLPHGLDRDLAGQLGTEAAKSTGMGKLVCDSGMGRRPNHDVLRELGLR
jgi:hypothetical protein